MCPKCDSPEWFHGAACFACGWEGNVAEAYSALRARLEALEDIVCELRNEVCPSHLSESSEYGWRYFQEELSNRMDAMKAAPKEVER